MDDADLAAVTPQLRELTVPTLIVWGTGDAFFDVSWAYRLRDTIPGTTRVVTVDGARLFFPDERPMDLVPHLEQHWAARCGPGVTGSPFGPMSFSPGPSGAPGAS